MPGDLPDKVHQRRCPLANRREDLLRVLQITGVAPGHDGDFLKMMLLREHRHRWHMVKAEPAVDFFRCTHDEIAPTFHDHGCLIKRPEHRTAVYGADRIRLE